LTTPPFLIIRAPDAHLPALALPGAAPQANEAQHFKEHIRNIAPIHHSNGNQGSQMQQHIEKQAALLRRGHAEEITDDGQMS
jgi:hypothetical protein